MRSVVFLLPLLANSLFGDDAYMLLRLINPDSREFITASGATIMNHPDLRPDEVMVFANDAQLTKLRNEANVAFMYPASTELIAGVPVNMCAPPPSDLVAELVMNVGRGWKPLSTGPVQLSYSLESVSPKLGFEQTVALFQKAATEWSRYAQIDFAYTDKTDAKRNLNIVFARGAHGDPYAFDGPRRTLAHTFYPADINPEPIAGDLHFDEDENWQTGVDPDFYSVVLHELGHALGLGHSDRPSSVMYPYYRRLESLLPDDIAAIRRLYATRDPETDPPSEPAGPAPGPEPAPTTPVVIVPAPTAPTTPAANSNDRTAPQLRIYYPATTISSTSATTAKITGVASDKVGVVSVTWSASGGRSGVAEGTTSWTISEIPLRMGDNAIVIRAYDEAGNSSFRNLTITRR